MIHIKTYTARVLHFILKVHCGGVQKQKCKNCLCPGNYET